MRSCDRILTTHVGALPAPNDLWSAGNVDEARLRLATREVVKLQRDCGVDLVNEGELTKGGSWVAYLNNRLTGFEARPFDPAGEIFRQSEDYKEFSEFYEAAISGGTLFEQTRSEATLTSEQTDFVCTGPVTYCGQSALKREIDALRDAIGGLPRASAFLTVAAPASIEPERRNQYYKSQEEFVYAIADAMRVEYRAIVDAGFQLQVDDAWLAALWDRIGVRMGIEKYKNYCAMRVDALNHALRGIPEDKIRYHLCWGSWHGPHAHDIPLKDIVSTLLKVKAQTYLIEAANVRHEHEYAIWKSISLPDNKVLAPGVVSHSTALVEHPELVSERIQKFANIVGRDRVIASTDCGLGLRCHVQIAWAKLRALSRGAAIASEALWG